MVATINLNTFLNQHTLPKACLLLVCHLLKLFDATLSDSSECHLHDNDFRHSLIMIMIIIIFIYLFIFIDTTK